MKIDESFLREFMDLYEKEFGERISTKEAREMATEYYISLGVLAYQVDCLPHIPQWERQK